MAKLPHVKRKQGRASTFTQAIADEFCDRLATGRSMRDVCINDNDMPPWRTVYSWLDQYPEFKKQFLIAKQHGAQVFRDKIAAITESVSTNKQLDAFGRKTSQLDPAAARLASENYRWLAGVTAPREFGKEGADDDKDKGPATAMLNVTLTGAATGRFNIQVATEKAK